MRPIRDCSCLLIALGSIALAAWQPEVGIERPADAAPPAAAEHVNQVQPQTIDRAVFSAPLPKA